MKALMKRIYLLFSVLSICSLLPSCGALFGEEIGRLPINEISRGEDSLAVKETSLDLKKDQEIAIWSDMDLEYEGNAAFRFRLSILKDGESFKLIEIDPTDKNVTVGEVQSTIMGKTNWSFSGKNGSFVVPEDANYTFKGVFVTSENPTIVVNKAELVFKK